ncbi:MAG: calcium/sodium antiporter [Thermodesulfobacteriota bacterium]
MWLHFILTAIGFAMLYVGAEWLVKGSASLARRLGISPIIIGLTVVAFGTSAPELVISMAASISGRSMIAVGNVVGSNICNITLVLGVAALLMPIPADRSVIRREIPLMLAISLFLVFLSLNSVITRLEGVVLFAGIIAYIGFNYSLWKKAQAGENGKTADLYKDAEKAAVVESGVKQGLLIIAGITFVVIGAQVLINAVVLIMENLGVSEKFVGLTVVAFGTSLPELATSVVAALKKEMDISIGNLVGSNVFNILSVLGATAIVRPISIPGGFIQSGVFIDYGVMLLAGIIAWLLMRKEYTLHRSGGVILLIIYAGYIGYLIKAG